jgi:hypothetical protein
MDILIEKKEMGRIDQILCARGYQRKQASSKFESRAYHIQYRRRISGFSILVEAHRDIDFADSPFAIDIDECWHRSHEVVKDFGTYYELSIEDTLILNCSHIVHHVSKRPEVLLSLKNFCDIAIILDSFSGAIDWECVVQRSRKYKVLRSIAFVLLLVHELFESVDIPPEIFEILHKEEFQEDFAVFAFREYIFSPLQPEKNSLPFWMIDFATASSMREKVERFKDVPKVFISLFQARYYGRFSRSIPRTIASVVWYYIRRVSSAIELWVQKPRKTSNLQQKMTSVNRKTQAFMDWLRN